ncbi:hypothetical protein QLQ12_36730 [Actinoplanes sp. NEAU-A12]|uniref:Uncharacterized protein n=1 Tax=Actinoplanes sandaracinus TaxID=3045177 RepID=A0ABT6WWN2_9ACTN|nr:hypothetical protein [Actinoplanes sandaracinus]MDI6104152.1 hypothetical protein [Actinoplanes sandaracinus]
MSSSTTKRWSGRAAAVSIFAGFSLLSPGMAPVAAAADAPARPTSVVIASEPGEVDWDAWEQENGNSSARCRKNESYFKVSYSGYNKIFVRLGGGQTKHYDDYYALRESSSFYSGALTSSKRNAEGYFQAPSDSSILTYQPGVVGILVQDPDTGKELWQGLWNFSMQCGYDYSMTVSDV